MDLCLKKAQLVFALLFTLALAGAAATTPRRVWAAPPTRALCLPQILADLVKNGKSENSEALLAAIEEGYREYGVFTQADRAYFLKIEKLRPLFNTGIVHEALLDELAARGFHKPKDIEAVIKLITSMPGDSSLDLVEKTTARIVGILGDDKHLANHQEILATAKHYHMSPEEMGQLLNAWKEIHERDPEFEELKSILILNLYQDKADLIATLKARRTWRKRVVRWFHQRRKKQKTSVAYDEVVKEKDPQAASLLYGTEAIKTADLVKSLENQPKSSLQGYLISQNYKLLTPKQLEQLLKDWNHVISPALKKKLLERLEDFAQFKTLIDRLDAQLTRKTGSKNVLESEITQDSIATQNSLAEDLRNEQSRKLAHLKEAQSARLKTEKWDHAITQLEQVRVAAIRSHELARGERQAVDPTTFHQVLYDPEQEVRNAILTDVAMHLTSSQLEEMIRSPAFHSLPSQIQTSSKMRLVAMKKLIASDESLAMSKTKLKFLAESPETHQISQQLL
ncbi:hypothetical protein WDW86_07425, partial [Bdellovibrionota bacterium FG-2]